jgi:hypothetical protein
MPCGSGQIVKHKAYLLSPFEAPSRKCDGRYECLEVAGNAIGLSVKKPENVAISILSGVSR